VKELLKLTAHELMAVFAGGSISPSEYFSLQLRFARHVEPLFGSFLSLANLDTLEYEEVLKGNGLHGVPVSIKDIIAVRGFPATAGSRVLEGYRPPYDATAARLLKERGNPIIGKTNMDEFAMGSSTEYSAYHPTRNPWDATRVPGGSSGGSAASVAALQSAISLGTDTGGSVRQPASFCGVVGFLPSYGFISRYGLIAYASSLDQVGIFARDVQDVALTMNTIARPDPLDATCQAPSDTDYVAAIAELSCLTGCRVGLIKPLLDEKLVSTEVLEVCEDAIEELKNMGCSLKQVDVPLMDMLLPCYHILSPAECSSNLARYDGIRYGLGFPAASSEMLQEHYRRVRGQGFGEEVKRRILSGTYVLSAGYAEEYYNRARMVRAKVAAAVAELFKEVDFLVAPTTPTVAFKLGERLDDPVAMYAADACTVLASLSSIPAISLPAGLGATGMPVGIQFMGPRGSDARFLAFARLYEQVSGEGYRIPPMVAEALARFEE
jgi:aspartyl-tRNA(Asn)/glutamyl-tRNA(Gln) amidotransferase subunit A